MWSTGLFRRHFRHTAISRNFKFNFLKEFQNFKRTLILNLKNKKNCSHSFQMTTGFLAWEEPINYLGSSHARNSIVLVCRRIYQKRPIIFLKSLPFFKHTSTSEKANFLKEFIPFKLPPVFLCQTYEYVGNFFFIYFLFPMFFPIKILWRQKY